MRSVVGALGAAGLLGLLTHLVTGMPWRWHLWGDVGAFAVMAFLFWCFADD
jgi:hypothetical protein